MFERILVPTDGSPVSADATDLAFRLAADYGADVHALYVLETDSPIGHYDQVVERWERQGERAVEAVAERGTERSIPVTKAFRSGEIHEEIVAYADDHAVDLIVIGTHGHTGFRRFVRAGSIAERVARITAVPVLIVGGAQAESGSTPTVGDDDGAG